MADIGPSDNQPAAGVARQCWATVEEVSQHQFAQHLRVVVGSWVISIDRSTVLLVIRGVGAHPRHKALGGCHSSRLPSCAARAGGFAPLWLRWRLCRQSKPPPLLAFPRDQTTRASAESPVAVDDRSKVWRVFQFHPRRGVHRVDEGRRWITSGSAATPQPR